MIHLIHLPIRFQKKLLSIYYKNQEHHVIEIIQYHSEN